MPCFHPIDAWRFRLGEAPEHTPLPDRYKTGLPCGRCIGCQTGLRREWAFRCQLELRYHDAASFTTLTYDKERLPPTLEPYHFQLFLKRLRTNISRSAAVRPIRFFGSGEYGEQNQRPHYHAILYGISELDRDLVEETWGMGRTQTVNATPASIAYTAGYTAKKIGWNFLARDHERVDPDTGEVYTWQRPFHRMSRRPGIADRARQYVESWKKFAVENGVRTKVPRFLHEAWRKQATPLQQEELTFQKMTEALTRDTSENRRREAQHIAYAKHKQQGEKRKL